MYECKNVNTCIYIYIHPILYPLYIISYILYPRPIYYIPYTFFGWIWIAAIVQHSSLPGDLSILIQKNSSSALTVAQVMGSTVLLAR